jgi:hypothetical protein
MFLCSAVENTRGNCGEESTQFMAIILQRTELTRKKKALLFSRLAVTRAMLITALK